MDGGATSQERFGASPVHRKYQSSNLTAVPAVCACKDDAAKDADEIVRAVTIVVVTGRGKYAHVGMQLQEVFVLDFAIIEHSRFGATKPLEHGKVLVRHAFASEDDDFHILG